MIKLYTLQECFEEAGSKFPLHIIFYTYGQTRNPIKYTILEKNKNGWNFHNKYGIYNFFQGEGKDFEIDKSFKFDDDIKDLLNE